MWLFTYLICLSVHLPTYLLSIHLSIHPSFYPSSVLFLPGTTDELSSLLSLAFSPHSMLALHFSLPLNDGFPAVGSTLHSPLHHQNFPSWINPSTSRHAAVSPVSEWVSEWVKVAQSCLTLRLHGQYSPWNSPGQNTGVGSLFLLQGIFPTQESNWGLLHCRQILCQLTY